MSRVEGVARTTRPCPFCGVLIYKGEPVALTRMGWVHADCKVGVLRQMREVRRMDREFRRVISDAT